MTSLWFGLVWFLSHTKSHLCHLFALNIHAAMVCIKSVGATVPMCDKYDRCECVRTKWHSQLRKYTAADVVNSHITPTETHTHYIHRTEWHIIIFIALPNVSSPLNQSFHHGHCSTMKKAHFNKYIVYSFGQKMWKHFLMRICKKETDHSPTIYSFFECVDM